MRATLAAADKPLHQRIPLLEDKHPLADWWNTYWVPHLQIALRPVANFLEAVPEALNQVNPNTVDLQKYLREKLEALYQQAKQATYSSFTQVADTLQNLPSETSNEQTLATLLRLSLLQMRYQDHLEARG